MPTVRITHIYDFAGQECRNSFSYWNPDKVPDLDVLVELASQFENTVLAGIAAIQNVLATGVGIEVYASNLGFTYQIATAVDGELAGALSDCVAVDNALVVTKQPGLTVQSNGDPYTGNRPCRKGRIFLSGVLKTWMIGTGSTIPAAQAGAWAGAQSGMLAPLPDDDLDLWQPCIDGIALPATASKPARPHVVAELLSIGHNGFSNLTSRQD